MTDMLQKTENVAKNVANKNSQDLTSQWKKGELPSGWYYVQLQEGVYVDNVKSIIMDYYTEFCDFMKHPYLIEQVLAPVPSYDELQNMNEAVNECMAANIKLVEENAQLKEQINKYYLDVINRGTANAVKAVKEFGMPERIKELVEQNTQLKELLRIILSKTQTCYSMVLQKDIISAELNEALLKKINEALK